MSSYLESLCPRRDHEVWRLRWPYVSSYLRPPRISVSLHLGSQPLQTRWCREDEPDFDADPLASLKYRLSALMP